MYNLEVFNNETKLTLKVLKFKTKKEANTFLELNCEKRGYDFFDKNDRTLEFIKSY